MHRRWTTRVVLALALTALAQAAAFAEDPYARLVKDLQNNYHGKRASVPFLGFANFVFKFWHPAGVKSVKLALFQDLMPTDATGVSFDTALSAAAHEWRPIVRVYSRPDHQWVYVYLLEEDKDVKVLVATHSQREGLVAQVKFNPEKLAEFIQNPQILGIQLARDIKHGPESCSSREKVEQGDTTPRPEPDAK